MNHLTRMMMPFGSLSLALLFCLLATGLHADTTLELKNGQLIVGKTFIHKGDTYFAVGAPGPDGNPVIAEVGTLQGDIAKVETDPPEILKTAPPLMAVGKAQNVLPDVLEALKPAELYGEIPGSPWLDLTVLQAHILLATGKDVEAAAWATSYQKSKNAELARDAKAVLALIAARKGDHSAAADLASPLLKEATRPSTLAAASVTIGLGYLEKKQFIEALKAFLELPVFLPDQTAFSGIAQLGLAQAYYGLDDYDRAIATAEELIKSQPGTPQVSIAQSLLPEWNRRRTVVNEAKEP